MIFESDRGQVGAGDLVFRTGGVERARIAHDGTGTGWSNVLGGSIPVPTGFLSPDLAVGQQLPAPRRYRRQRGTPSLISTFQSGHGFITAGTGVTSGLNDTTDYVLGSQAAWFASNGSGATCWLKTSGLTNVDLTGKAVVLWVKVEDWTKVNSLQIQIGDTNFTNAFGAELQSSAGGITAVTRRVADNEWARLVIPKSKFTTAAGTPNWATITCWQLRLVDNSTGSAKVHWNGIGYVADGSSDWSHGVVSLTFDDGLASVYTQAKMYMDKYGFPGTAYAIKDNVGAAGYATLAQLKQMQDYSNWEIAGHAYTQANHDLGFDTLDTATVEAELYKDKAWLVANGFRGHDHFAWPKGQFNATIEAIAARYFSTIRLTDNVQSVIVPPANPFRLTPRCWMQSTTTTATIEGYIDLAYTNGDWLIFGFHDIVTSTSGTNDYSIANFQTLIDYLNTKGIPVRTVGDVMATYN